MRPVAALLCALLGACASSSVGSQGDGGGNGGDGGGNRDGGGPPDGPPGVEICDGVDNDGDQFVDEGGDELCMPVPPSAIPECNGLGGCRIGGCIVGFADLDNNYGNGCECAQEAGEPNQNECAASVDLGTIPDDNSVTLTVIGNLVPVDDVDYYRFLASDLPDATCDNYHVRARIVNDVNGDFLIEAWRGGCGGAQICPASTDMQWYMNFLGPGAPPAGQCPCTPSGSGSATVNNCLDDSAEFIIKVTRAPGKPVSCTDYTLEISNGAYPPP